jgi:hypothetical protein
MSTNDFSFGFPADGPLGQAPRPQSEQSLASSQRNDDAIIDATIVESSNDHTVVKINMTERPIDKGSVLERFINSFFKQENIRWIAVMGAAIVVASSLMLVTREWSVWSVTAKYLVILGYTGLCYLLSDLGRKHFGLQITARVLQFLTLLLLPMCFLSLSWLFAPTSPHWSVSGVQLIFYLIPTIGLTWFAGSRIFDHLWRGRQTTYLLSFLLLCTAGAIPRIEVPWIAALVTLALWAIATVGTIKINRHVFWLTEEHRQPRAFGFLPIALLGLQFAVLIATKTSLSLPIEWMGFGLVLIATTILLTTRTVAEVHRQRTGGVIKTLPLHLIVPLVVGVALAMFGVIVSFYGFSYGAATTFAAVPTALLASYLMFRTACDTKKQAFVWISLVLLLVGYQSAPTLVSGLVQQLKANAAMAVGEERLPYAFYGLTYLPLTIGLAIASGIALRRGQLLFANPTKQFVTVLSLGLMALSWTHMKAVFPVAVIQVALYGWFAYQFSDRRFALLSLGSLTIATGSWIAFTNAMGFTAVANEHAIASLAVLAFLMMISKWIDRVINAIPLPENGLMGTHTLNAATRQIAFTWGAVLTVFMTAAWWILAARDLSASLTFQNGIRFAFPFSNARVVEFSVLATNLWLIARHTRHYVCGLGFWLLIVVGTVLTAVGMQVELKPIAEVVTFLCVAISLFARYPLKDFGRFVHDETAAAHPMRAVMLFPLYDICVTFGLLLSTVLYVPSILWANISLTVLFTPIGVITVYTWLLILRGMYGNRIAGTIATVSLPLVTAALVISVLPMKYSHQGLLLIWALTAVANAITLRFLGYFHHDWVQSNLSARDANPESINLAKIRETLTLGPVTAWFAITLLFSFISLSDISAVTVMVSLAGLVILHWERMTEQAWTWLGVVVNLQILISVVRCCGDNTWFEVFNDRNFGRIDLPMLMLSIVVSLAIWDVRWSRLDELLRQTWTVALRMAFLPMLVVNFAVSMASHAYTELLMATLGAAMIVELVQSVRKQSNLHLWIAVGIIASAIGWLVALQVLTLGSGLSQIVLILLAITTLATSKWINNHPRFGYACKTLDQLGLAAPAVAVLLAVWHGFTSAGDFIPGVDSLVILSCAAIYFHRGITRKQRAYTVVAGLTTNIASILLWTSLGYHDFQLYLVPFGLTIIGLVELLKVETPPDVRTGLRYIGSLTILVSPVFEIMHNSWLHLLTLMILCVLLILLAIGLRLKPLLNTATAFLLADLVGMVIRSANDHPGLLWIGGLAVGVAVIALAAICENQRERLLSRIRILSAELATWN